MKKMNPYIPAGRPAAAALKYKAGEDHAPRLTAKGFGKIAEKIITIARENGIPLHEDPDLLALLMQLDINEFIPPEMYLAVAEVLAFVYRLNSQVQKETAAH